MKLSQGPLTAVLLCCGGVSQLLLTNMFNVRVQLAPHKMRKCGQIASDEKQGSQIHHN